jgi:hypothetical protein
MDTQNQLLDADRHIADCTRRIAEQGRRIAELQTAGHDTSLSTDILDLLTQALIAHVQYRKSLLCKIGERRGRMKLPT